MTERNEWDVAAERIASRAICTEPFVPFLKPTGIEQADASSR